MAKNNAHSFLFIFQPSLFAPVRVSFGNPITADFPAPGGESQCPTAGVPHY